MSNEMVVVVRYFVSIYKFSRFFLVHVTVKVSQTAARHRLRLAAFIRACRVVFSVRCFVIKRLYGSSLVQFSLSPSHHSNVERMCYIVGHCGWDGGRQPRASSWTRATSQSRSSSIPRGGAGGALSDMHTRRARAGDVTGRTRPIGRTQAHAR